MFITRTSTFFNSIFNNFFMLLSTLPLVNVFFSAYLKHYRKVDFLFFVLFFYYVVFDILKFVLLLDYQLLFYAFEFSMLLPVFVLSYAYFFEGVNSWQLKRLALVFFLFPFLISLILWGSLVGSSLSSYNNYGVVVPFAGIYSWGYSSVDSWAFAGLDSVSLNSLLTNISWLNVDAYFGTFSLYLDGVSYFFVLLTTFLVPVCLLVSWYSIQERVFLFLLLLVILEFFLVNCFVVSNLFYFFLFFEAVLFPMFFIIGIWGSRDRKIHAVYQFLLYTLVGSIFLYVALFYMLFNFDTLDYLVLKDLHFSTFDQRLLFLLFFVSFAFKIPLFPVHIWLPEAHVEAPTFGSVILAGLLLKLGTYGMMRFLIPLFPEAVVYYMPLVFTLVIIGIFYTSFSTIRQLDLKKIIAYSSVGHMGFVILGLFTTYVEGFSGSLFLMIGHGVVSSALFICVGLLYDRYHTRNVTDLRCLVRFMPVFGVFFLFFTLANVSFPGTFNFVAEVNVLVALGQVNLLAAIISVFSIVFIMVYAFWLNNRILFGNSSAVLGKYEIIGKYMDLSLREFVLLFSFLFLTLLGGFFPNMVINWYLPYCDGLNLLFDSNLVC